jgi:hypothetical protein
LALVLFQQEWYLIFFTLIVDGTFMGVYVKMASLEKYSTIDSYTTTSRLRCSDKCTSNEVGIILNPIKKNIEVLVQTLRQKNYSAKLAINHI